MPDPELEKRPALPWIKLGEDTHVEAFRCAACSATMTSEPLGCPSCGSTGTLRAFRVAETGRLHCYSIVHRSFPGVATPFVSAIVDMDDGVTLKGVLRGVAPDPGALSFGLRVRMRFDDALGRRDSAGHPYVSYFFEPLAAAG